MPDWEIAAAIDRMTEALKPLIKAQTAETEQRVLPRRFAFRDNTPVRDTRSYAEDKAMVLDWLRANPIALHDRELLAEQLVTAFVMEPREG